MRQVIVVWLLLFASCSRPGFDLLSHRLRGSGNIGERTGQQPFAVVMLVDPSDVFACGNGISRWMEWGRRNPGQFLLVFRRPPTSVEARQLVPHRIRPDGVLYRPGAAPENPHEFLIASEA